MMLMQYSVSPRRMLNSFGPKPSENVSTRTPCQRATMKWPSSWTKTSTPRTNKNGSSEYMNSSSQPESGQPQSSDQKGPRADHFSSIRARPAVQFLDFREVRRGAGAGLHAPGVPIERVGNGRGNPGKGQLPLQERRYSHLVGRIQHD